MQSMRTAPLSWDDGLSSSWYPVDALYKSSQRDEEESDAVGTRPLTSSRKPLQHCQTRTLLTPTIYKMKYLLALERPTIIYKQRTSTNSYTKQIPFCSPH